MNWFKQIFTASSGRMSSKRVCGVLGFLVVIGILIYCTILVIQAPSITTEFMIGCMGLLGLDSVTDIWKKKHETDTSILE